MGGGEPAEHTCDAPCSCCLLAKQNLGLVEPYSIGEVLEATGDSCFVLGLPA